MTTVHERTLAALAEVNPPVAAGLAAAGRTIMGHPLPGYLGWLPPDELDELARAWLLAWGIEQDAAALSNAKAAFRQSVWRHGRGVLDQAATAEAVIAWSKARGDRFPLLDLLQVCASGEVLT